MIMKAILWEEWVIFKRKFWKITSGALVSPIMYMIAFGWGLGSGIELNGHPYIYFIIPGVISLTTMNTSYSTVSTNLSINKLYDKTFEQYLISPIPVYSFVAGKVIAGALRGMYAGAIIIGISYIARVNIHISLGFLLIMLLNGLAFASLGFFAALIADSHADMNRFSTYFIMPMTFLCGTFFSPDKLPLFIKNIIYVLPLTHASEALRGMAIGNPLNLVNLAVILVYFVVLFALAVRQCYKATD